VYFRHLSLIDEAEPERIIKQPQNMTRLAFKCNSSSYERVGGPKKGLYLLYQDYAI
jgi:hypothetical protein